MASRLFGKALPALFSGMIPALASTVYLAQKVDSHLEDINSNLDYMNSRIHSLERQIPAKVSKPCSEQCLSITRVDTLLKRGRASPTPERTTKRHRTSSRDSSFERVRFLFKNHFDPNTATIYQRSQLKFSLFPSPYIKTKPPSRCSALQRKA